MIYRITKREFHSWLDGLIRPEFRIGQKLHSAFRVCGYIGLILAIFLVVSLVAYLGLSQIVMAGIAIVAMATFLVLAMATKIIIGEERLIYYHQEIAIVLVVTMVLWFLDQPILPYLDITTLGIGTFLAFGRVGCLMVGCCHGRPSRLGVCYTPEHAHAGFTPYYVGVRLFPIQAVESLWVFGTVVVGIALVLLDSPAGAAMAWYIITYDIGRFFFEFLRGDPDRHYLMGFSEGQWTSILLMMVVVSLELSGWIPYETWHFVATAVLLLTMIGIASKRRYHSTANHRLTNPRHVRELAKAVGAVSGPSIDQACYVSGGTNPDNIPISSTSLGILLSASESTESGATREHYALSCEDGNMTDEVAHAITDIILTIRHSLRLQKKIKGKNGVYHLILRSDS